MKVKDLIIALHKFNPEHVVVGRCQSGTMWKEGLLVRYSGRKNAVVIEGNHVNEVLEEER